MHFMPTQTNATVLRTQCGITIIGRQSVDENLFDVCGTCAASPLSQEKQNCQQSFFPSFLNKHFINYEHYMPMSILSTNEAYENFY